MVFCTPEQHEAFLDSAPEFEGMLRQGGTTLIKYWLDFSLEEETERMEARRLEPLKSGKTFSIDRPALEKFDDYAEARNLMLWRTSTSFAPWTIVRTSRKWPARIAIIKDLLSRFDYPGKDAGIVEQDRGIMFEFGPVYRTKAGWKGNRCIRIYVHGGRRAHLPFCKFAGTRPMARTPEYFVGKTIIITGAVSGIDAATALIFAREGANIVLADINKEKADEVAAEVKKLGAGAQVVAFDVPDRADVKKLVKAAVAKFGMVDFLFNSEGAPVACHQSWRSIKHFGNRHSR